MNRIVITGGPGFGKSSIIRELENRRYSVFHEVSREVLDHQVKTGGDVLPWKDHQAFNEVVFKGRLESFHAAANSQVLYFYDRGLPDSLAYLLADDKQIPEHFRAEAKHCNYYHRVFFTPPWKEIYQVDNERWEEFTHAEKIHASILRFYEELGYELVEIPKISVQDRVNFILDRIKSDFPDHRMLL